METVSTLPASKIGQVAEVEDQQEHPIAGVARGLRDAGMHLFFFLPLVFSPGWTVSLFELSQSTALALFTVLTTASGLVYVLLRGRFALRRTAVDIPLLILLSVSLLSTIFSIAPLFSFYGEYARRDGLLTMANYALLYWMAASYFVEWRGIRRAVEILVLVGGFVALIGVVESQGLALHGDYAREAFGGRVFSTIGNPDFLGAYMVLVAPLAIGLLTMSIATRMKLLWSAVFVLMGVCLLATLTRGAWIGFGASMLVLAFFIRSQRRHALWLIGSLVVVLVLGLGLEGLRPVAPPAGAQPAPGIGTEDDGAPVVSPSWLERLSSMSNLEDGSIQVRFETWGQALAVVRDHPLLGTGPNTFQMVASRYYSPEYARGEGIDHMPDRPHNYYLQWAAFAGVPGLLSYLAVLSATLWCWVRWLLRNSRGPRRLLLVGILSGWVGYAVQNFFLFQTIPDATQFWLITALGVAITRPSIVHIRLWQSPRSSVFVWTSVVAIAVAAAFLSFLVVRPVVADVLFMRGQNLLAAARTKADVAAAHNTMQAAISWMPQEQYYRETYALMLLGKAAGPGLAEPDRQRDLATALAVITPALADNPQHANLHFNRGAVRAQLGESQLREAYRDYRRAAELHPYDLKYNQALARAARTLGNVMEAIAAERRLLVVYPQRVSTLVDLAQDYLAVGSVDEAQEMVDRLSRLMPDDAFAALLQGRVYEARGDRTAAAAQYELALQRRADLKAAQDGLERVWGQATK